MNKTSRKIDAGLAVVLNVLFLAGFMVFYEFIHEANDDLAIALLLEGAYGEYSEYVIYQNVIWARFVIFLNQLIPQVKWYMVLMFAVIFTNFTAVTYVFLRVQGRKIGTLFSSILLLFAGYETYVIFQYTRIAAVVTAGGMLLLFYALEHAQSNKEKWCCIVLGGLLAIWGSMIRFPMFGVAVILSAAALGLRQVWKLLHEKQEGWQKQIGTYIAVFGMVGLCSIGLYIYDAKQYSSDEYLASVIEYNDVRTELWDYGFPNYGENLELYQSLGISENDFIYHFYWNMDFDSLTMDVLNTLADAKEEKTFQIFSFLGMFPKWFEQYSMYLLFMILSIVAVCVDRKNIYYVLMGFFGVMLFEAMFFYMGRCGFARVDVGMWMAAFLGLAYAVAEDFKKYDKVSWKWIIGVFLAVLFLNTVHVDPETHEMSGMVASTKDTYEIISKDKENLYMLLTFAPSIYYAFDYWEPCEKGEFSNIYNVFGWEQMNKVKDGILDSYGISSIYRDSIDNENVYFIAGSGIEMFQQYLQENYGENVYLSYEGEVNGVALWRIKTAV